MSYALGLDFGTESVRALVVDCATGEEAAQAVVPYRHGVISGKLPGTEKALPPDFALQDPRDYVESSIAAIREVLARVPAREIAGVGVDFTACTVVPARRDGTPLVEDPRLASDPHAWGKLWKHHAPRWEAERVVEAARERGEPFLKYYGGEVSCEWMLPKCWEVLRRAPEVYQATEWFADAGDWIVQRITGVRTRNSCAAGYKGLWNAELGFPSRAFLAALDPGLEDLASKWVTDVTPSGTRAGCVSASFAARSGLVEGTPVAAATIDAHSGVAGMGIYREGAFSIIMGTSSCHMVLSRELRFFEGYAGVTQDGILPGFYGYESGQPAVGDIFGWFARRVAREDFDELSRKASALAPGEAGVLALDWQNGNRSVLMNPKLSGLVLGLTLETRPEEIYRALIEATAFGSRRILESYSGAGIRLEEVAVCGGLARDPLILGIYADVLGLPVKVAASRQAVALGAAIFGALAAGTRGGGYDDAETAIVRMTRPPERTVRPNPEARAAYDELYALYLEAHDLFGRKHPELMARVRQIRERNLR